MSTPAEVVRIPFHGTELLATDVAGKPHIVLKPAVEGLGVSYSAQLAKLRRRSWAVVSSSATTGSDGKTYQMVTVDVRTFLMLLATIEESRVAEHVRPLLAAYQAEVADVIESYWTKGAAVQPGVEVDPEHEVPQTFAQALRLAAEQLERAEAAEGKVAELEPKIEAAKTRIASMEPKAAYVDAFINPAEDVTTIGDFAKELGIRAKDLRDYLVQRKRIYKRVLPRRWSASKQREDVEYEWRYHAGFEAWFTLKEQPDAPRRHNGQIRMTLYVTPIGKERIRRMLDTDPIGGAA